MKIPIGGTYAARCRCGALTDQIGGHCHKCVSRFRWLRRRTPH
ncbi:hypothetical protein [Herbidospora sp. RD11066]